MTDKPITDALFYISVVEDKGKPPILAEGMEISTRSRGESILYKSVCRSALYHDFTSGGNVCCLF